MKKEIKKKGWLVEHYGLGSGIFTVYESRQKAEYEIHHLRCECKLKPVKCTVIYLLPL